MVTLPQHAVSDLLSVDEGTESLAPGLTLLRGYAATQASACIEVLGELAKIAPFRHMVTPGGRPMSVAMTNCGSVGWVSDKKGYRYEPIDPLSGQAWPQMPKELMVLAQNAAELSGYKDFCPDACLINLYRPGARLSLHQDQDERDFAHPVVSVSLGLPAVFLFGGLEKKLKTSRIHLYNGDVLVFGGPLRLAFHGVEPLAAGVNALTGSCRINLTFRKAC